MLDRIFSIIIKGALIFVFAVAIILPVFGIIHAFTKHSVGEGIICIILPPAAYYYGIEPFWHAKKEKKKAMKRKKDVDTAIKNFTEICIRQSVRNNKYPRLTNNQIQSFCHCYAKKAVHGLLSGEKKAKVRLYSFECFAKIRPVSNPPRPSDI